MLLGCVLPYVLWLCFWVAGLFWLVVCWVVCCGLVCFSLFDLGLLELDVGVLVVFYCLVCWIVLFCIGVAAGACSGGRVCDVFCSVGLWFVFS